ncbi:protein of unknown function DUF513 hemX [Nitrosococcus halophilus Nc 4]|uniref:HemX domain protein n=1 Tax=Nitrosococcus halophilus (strain Nc4) TaxID=472759 RepID=D5C407_NITHN|nr:uroporphyrinogen-III C-methyltransferase [Nitrosococcus halophilus]ADE16944.1 protein of unknown function DUF513 hemX [Nitrosococcus halophilus Nc 4]
MSDDKEENLPGRRRAKGAHRSKKKQKKAGSSAETTFNEVNSAVTGEANAKAPEPERPETQPTAPKAESTVESPEEKGVFSSETESNQPAFVAPGGTMGNSSDKPSPEAASEESDFQKTKEAEQESKTLEPEQPMSEGVAAGAAAEASPAEGEDGKPAFKPSKAPASDGRGRGRSMAGFMILAVALILVAAGDAYYARSLAEKEREAREALSKKLTEQLDSQVDSRVASQVDERLAGREEPLQQAVSSLKGELEGNANELEMIQKEMAALESALRILRTEIEQGPQPGNWDIAEAAYLMRIANERLQLERDVNTALVALQTADQILREVADPALTPVRAKLAEEISSLKAVPVPDIDGMALSLTSLIDRVEELELKETVLEEPTSTPKVEEQASEQAPEAEGNTYIAKAREFLQVIWSDLKNLVVVRRRGEGEGGGIPILPPEERYFLYQNLRLELESARLSLLQKNEGSFRQSLQLAQSWLQTYFQGPEAKVMEDTLVELEQTAIKPALPEISGSLKALERVQEHIGPQAAGGGEGGKA